MRRRLDIWGWIWWADAEDFGTRFVWFDVVTKTGHWLCACGNDERLRRRRRLKAERWS